MMPRPVPGLGLIDIEEVAIEHDTLGREAVDVRRAHPIVAVAAEVAKTERGNIENEDSHKIDCI